MAKRGFLFGAKFLSKTTKRGVALNAIILHAIAFLILITLIPNTSILTAITNIGVSITFFLTLIAVVRYNLKHKDYLQLGVASLGFISLIIILYFTWTTAMGTNDNLSRFIYATPIFVGVPLGLMMYKYLKCSQSKKVS